MAEQPLAGPAPAPALVFTAREPSEFLKQRYGKNEEFFEVPFLPPSLAGAFAGGYKDTDGKIVFPRSMIAAMDRYDPAAPVMRGVNSPLFIGGALIRDPRAVPNLCKADSGLSAMFWYLGSNIVNIWPRTVWGQVRGVGARCGNGLFSTYKSPKILS